MTAGDEHVQVTAQRLGRSDRFVGCVLERLVVVLGKKKRGRHQSTPTSFLSLSTSSPTDFTLTPALRPGGSLVLSTCSRGEMSTPKLSGVFSSIGFFFAFMMLGRLA